MIARAECRKLDIADNGSQQIVEIVRDAACKLTDHLQLLGLAEALLHLPALRDIPHRAGEPEGMAVLVPIETTFGDDPARFVIRPDNSAFEVEFSGVQRLAEGCLERPSVFQQNSFTYISAPFGQNGPHLRGGVLPCRIRDHISTEIEVPGPHLGGFERHRQALLRGGQLIVRFL